jgi:hypothetical protein
VTKLATFEKTFPLYDLVSENPPVYSVDETNIFFVRDLTSVKVKELVHFGMGMFFKAAVHGWQRQNGTSDQSGAIYGAFAFMVAW